MALGADEYITKPIQTTKILEAARRLLNLGDNQGATMGRWKNLRSFPVTTSTTSPPPEDFPAFAEIRG